MPQEERSYLVGLVGSGIGPSLSPALHEREAGELGLRYTYRNLDLDELHLPPTAAGHLLVIARAAGYRGLNVTYPCKQLIIEHLDALSPTAEAVGAVNTVLFTDGQTIGHNTDVLGFAEGVRRGLPGARLHRTVLLGAGGAGSAVGHALLDLGAGTVRVFDIDERRATSLAASLCEHFGPYRASSGSLRGDALADALRRADGLVNATPIGMWTHQGMPLPAALLRPDLWVADVVYRPLDTELLIAASACGCRILNGGLMAVFQAAYAFRLFTGHEPDEDRMLRHFATLVEATTHRDNDTYAHS